MTEDTHSSIKPVDWVGSSKKDLKGFPGSVIREIGVALLVAQYGGKHPSAKPMSGLGAGVLEIVENHDGETYRAVYTVRFKSRIYVLHCFQKKSKRGIKTPKAEMDVVRARLKAAQADHDGRGE